MSVTQADIARRLGISQPAVGAVLGDHSHRSRIRVRTDLRRRVLAAASRLSYRPHRYAQIMRKGKSQTIALLQFGGFLYVNDLRALYAARAIHGHRYHLLSHHVLWHERGVQAALDAILDARAEGLLLVGPTELVPPSFLKQICNSGIAVVALSGVRFPGVPQVRSDVRQGMFDLTRHVLSLGYRKLVLLTSWGSAIRDEHHCWPALERMAGFREAALEAKLREGKAEVVVEPWEPDLLAPPSSGKVAMQKLLRRSNRPEAVLCTNDNWAIGAISACAEAAVRAPEEIAITGFDNDVLGQFSVPPLTTVAQPIEAMAQKAVELLVRTVQGEKPSAPEDLIKLPCELVVRRSCGERQMLDCSRHKKIASPRP